MSSDAIRILPPWWRTNGRWLAFSQDTLKKVATSGGAVVSICPAPAGRGGWWGEDDVIVFASRRDPEATPAGMRERLHPAALPRPPRQWWETLFSAEPPIPTYGPAFDIHPDGVRFAVPPMQPLGGETARGTQLVLLFNFFDELRRLAPFH